MTHLFVFRVSFELIHTEKFKFLPYQFVYVLNDCICTEKRVIHKYDKSYFRQSLMYVGSGHL